MIYVGAVSAIREQPTERGRRERGIAEPAKCDPIKALNLIGKILC